MDIEALIKKHMEEQDWYNFPEDSLRAALTEADAAMAMEHNLKMLQVEAAHAIELRAYEATVQNQAERIRQLEEERVPEGWKLVPNWVAELVQPDSWRISHRGCLVYSLSVGYDEETWKRLIKQLLAAAPAKEGE